MQPSDNLIWHSFFHLNFWSKSWKLLSSMLSSAAGPKNKKKEKVSLHTLLAAPTKVLLLKLPMLIVMPVMETMMMLMPV